MTACRQVGDNKLSLAWWISVEFEAILMNIESSKHTRDAYSDPVSNKQTNQPSNKEKEQ